jgi:cytidine deaminase
MNPADPLSLLQAAAAAAHQAYAPYSSYPVGAALRCADGALFTGCNVENASYSLTTCAERTAVFTAVAAGRRAFDALAIVAPGDRPPYPCGACRQVLAEFCPGDLPVFIAPAGRLDDVQSIALRDLLPYAFRLAPPNGRTT